MPVESAPAVPAGLVRTLLGSVPEGVVACDRDLRYVVWNRYMETLTGLSAAEVLGRDVLEPFPFLRRRGLGRLLARALAGETVRLADTPYRIPGTGRSGWVAGQYGPLLDDAGAVTGIVGTIHEITDRKRTERTLRDSEERMRAFFDAAAVGIAIVDREGTLVAGNPALQQMLGFGEEELAGMPLDLLAHPADVRAGAVAFREVVEGRVQRWQGESRFLRRDGSVLWGRLSASAMQGADGEPWLSVGMVEDVTEHRRAMEENLRLAAFVRESPNPVVECGAGGEVLFQNPAAAALVRDTGAGELRRLLPANHVQLVHTGLALGQVFRGVEVPVGGRIFAWTYHPHPAFRAVHLFAEDITGRRAVEEQLRHDALHDALTGLPNRLLFMEHLARAILLARRDDAHQFAVLFLDLDRFKVVNDGLGHHVGDDLLVAVAGRLRASVRERDTVARFGGDEFAVLLDGIPDAEFASRAAERIQAAVSAPVALSGYEVFTSATIGIALSSSAYGRPEYLLRNADMAMYRAKAAGMGRYEVFDRAMHAAALLRLQTETDLRHAQERGEFRVFYQPILSLGDGRIAGMEALVRWAHPERGWISPPDFVPAAEETGLIFALGGWVLREACRQLGEWRRTVPGGEALTVSVNLSVKQFSQADLLEQVRRALDEAGLEPGALRLEVTESVLVENLESAAAILGRLKALGLKVHMDDFGTGYSSLGSLHRLPIDALKVDRSFVARLGTGRAASQLVRTIATLARELGLAVVAEGVETAEQLAELRALRCEYGQGYYFSVPVDADAMRALLLESPTW
ncbi:MAG: domain S-box/diguanylate cyclase protein [Gemmatimonadetes bacterium]|nr:domain S-box/diguanylate cyclase protein [Gemmatimonadota bacterium]